MTRLCQKVHRLEAQACPQRLHAILTRVRQCAPADLAACLQDELAQVDRDTEAALLDQLTDTELEVLIGPEAGRLMATRSDAELAALARGEPAAMRRFRRALRAEQHRGDSCV